MTSILTQVQPTSLEYLFSKPADEITEAEAEIVVKALRDERARWLLSEQTKAAKPKKSEAKANLSLDELDL